MALFRLLLKLSTSCGFFSADPSLTPIEAMFKLSDPSIRSRQITDASVDTDSTTLAVRPLDSLDASPVVRWLACEDKCNSGWEVDSPDAAIFEF